MDPLLLVPSIVAGALIFSSGLSSRIDPAQGLTDLFTGDKSKAPDWYTGPFGTAPGFILAVPSVLATADYLGPVLEPALIRAPRTILHGIALGGLAFATGATNLSQAVG